MLGAYLLLELRFVEEVVPELRPEQKGEPAVGRVVLSLEHDGLLAQLVGVVGLHAAGV